MSRCAYSTQPLAITWTPACIYVFPKIEKNGEGMKEWEGWCWKEFRWKEKMTKWGRGWCWALWVVRQQWRASCHNERGGAPSPSTPQYSSKAPHPPIVIPQCPTSRVCPHNTGVGLIGRHCRISGLLPVQDSQSSAPDGEGFSGDYSIGPSPDYFLRLRSYPAS